MRSSRARGANTPSSPRAGTAELVAGRRHHFPLLRSCGSRRVKEEGIILVADGDDASERRVVPWSRDHIRRTTREAAAPALPRRDAG